MVAHGARRRDVYRYVPPEQVIARAVTYIGDVLIEFALTFTGSLTVTCSPDEAARRPEDRVTLQIAGASLHRIADGLYISAVKADRPVIESAGGHRFTHATSTLPRAADAAVRRRVRDLDPGRQARTNRRSAGSLRLRAGRHRRPRRATRRQQDGASMWNEHYDRTLASIGAVVLAPVPVAADRAARLYAT